MKKEVGDEQRRQRIQNGVIVLWGDALINSLSDFKNSRISGGGSGAVSGESPTCGESHVPENSELTALLLHFKIGLCSKKL